MTTAVSVALGQASAGVVRPRWCRQLAAIDAADVQQVGAKAMNLSVLLRAGFAVPDGFVIVAEAFARAMASATSTEEGMRTAVIEDDLREEIALSLRRLGADLVAVRSSAVGEDGECASFAGQFETILNVTGLDQIIDAVRQCWASALGARAAAYGRAVGGDLRPMAVLVQRQLQPRCAGVAFTADPVTGDRDTVVINALSGLGERVVSGAASPDVWYVRGASAMCERAVEHCLTAGEARRIAVEARRVAVRFGAPRDVEWAYAGDALYLLQARPITGLPERAAMTIKPPHGFWQRNDTYYPHPLSPLFRSFFLDALNAAYRRFFAECGALAVGIVSREIGGWVYMRAEPFGGRDVPLPPRWVMWLALRLFYPMRTRIAAAVTAVREDRFGRFATQWNETWRTAMKERAAAVRTLDMSRLTDAELASHLLAVRRLVDEALEIHFLIVGAHFFPLAELAFTCRDLLGWDESRWLGLLAGLSDTSTAPALALDALAGMARSKPSLHQRILDDRDGDSFAAAVSEDQEFAAAFDRFIEEFGHRVLRYEIAEPTVAEQPWLVLGWLRAQLLARYDGARIGAELQQARAAALAAARRQLAGRPAADRDRFERVLARAMRAYPLREENELGTLSEPLAAMRHVALEAGRRLAANSVIARRDDVFSLELPEVVDSLSAPHPRQELVRRRRDEHSRVVANPGPREYGTPVPIPDTLPGLPPEAQFVHRALIWMRDHGFAPNKSNRRQAAGPRIDGIAAARGTYTGPARIIRSEAEFGRIRPGDVLVCPTTAPVWSAVFGNIGALVTDTGGILSHSAIIAREYGIPAVLATGNATELLRDGQLVTVDGDAAHVTAHTGDAA